MLTGMIETSAGRATLYGRDVNTEMDEIRTFMGVCPQVRRKGKQSNPQHQTTHLKARTPANLI